MWWLLFSFRLRLKLKRRLRLVSTVSVRIHIPGSGRREAELNLGIGRRLSRIGRRLQNADRSRHGVGIGRRRLRAVEDVRTAQLDVTVGEGARRARSRGRALTAGAATTRPKRSRANRQTVAASRARADVEIARPHAASNEGQSRQKDEAAAHPGQHLVPVDVQVKAGVTAARVAGCIPLK